jgi:hypothetical protein
MGVDYKREFPLKGTGFGDIVTAEGGPLVQRSNLARRTGLSQTIDFNCLGCPTDQSQPLILLEHIGSCPTQKSTN